MPELSPSADFDALALTLLAPYADQPAPRARRITGIYACLYLEDPLRFGWCGLATLVSRQVALALTAGGLGLGEMLADGNLAIYRSLMPDFLRARARVPVHGPLAPGFALLAEADQLARHDAAAALTRSDLACAVLSRLEQRDVVQPVYDTLSGAQRALLARFVYFRLGWDQAAPIVQFHGHDAADVDERLAWMEAEVLPRWAAWRRAEPELVRADIDRIRRECGVRGELLP